MKKILIITIGSILIILGLIILAIIPDASTKFFVGVLITWLGIIILGKTITKGKFPK